MLLDKIASYFKEWDGIEETAPKMELSIDDLRYIVSIYTERCRLLKNVHIKEHNYENCHNLTCRRKCEKDGYNRAINDFTEQLSYIIKSQIDNCVDELDWIDKIAEQLRR